MQTTIYFIRHGECAGNRERRIRGCVDFPLNENGVRQAEALAEWLKDSGIEHIITSPLSRAVQTAEILGRRIGVVPTVRDGFRNVCLGVWENRLQSDIMRESPKEWNIWMTDPESLRVEGAESIDEARARSLSALEDAVREFNGQTIALVSHRALLKPMLAGALGVARPCFWRLHLDNAAYGILAHGSHGFCLRGLNYTEHLKSLDMAVDLDSM